MYHVIMSPSDMFGSKHFATGCATMNINVNIMLTPIHIIRMAPISLEFTKEHKTSFFRGCASSRLDEKHNQVLGSTTKVIYRTKMSLVAPPNAGLRFISPR